MADVRELQRKLHSIKALREVVTAMRNLAAIYVRRAEATLSAARPYSDVVGTALTAAMDHAGARAPEDGGAVKRLAVVFASDQGLCGTYNERVVRAAVEFARASEGQVEFAAVGRRGRDLLKLHGLEPVLAAAAPTSLEGIKAQAAALAADVFDAYCKVGADEMHFVWNAYEGMGRFRESVRRVLPPERDALGGETAAFRCEPIITIPPAELLGALAEEYFFIELHRALLESNASENGARLVAMTAAGTNIDRRIVELTQQYQSVRQEAITSELLDVVSGAEALKAGTDEA